MKEVLDGKIDTQPDTYSLNVNGLSATLVIDYTTSTGYSTDQPELKVFPTLNTFSNGVKQIAAWQIIDGDGNIYNFGGAEAMETTHYYENNHLEGSRTYTSAWKVTSITTGRLKEVVNFNYVAENWTNDQPIVSYYSLDANPTVDCSSMSSSPNLNPFYKITSSQLSSIKFSSENASRILITRIGREDLPGQTAISQIRFNDQYGLATSYVKFNTGYFSTGPSHLEKRLKLNSVSFHGDSENSLNPQIYSFTYNSTPLPSRDSMAKDYFGYYNGITSNTTLLSYNDILGNGANREVNPFYTQAGILTNITYPTKGSTHFIYQPNKIFSFSSETLWQNAATFSWTSGNPENYCDDVVAGPLYVQYYQFTAPVTGDYKINFTANLGNESMAQLVALYKGNKTLCELVWDNGPDVIYKQYSQAINQEAYVTLEANTIYKVAMANNSNINSSMLFNIAYLQIISNEEYKNSSGVRIAKVEDYSAVNQLAKKRYFYYGDASGLSGQTIIDLVNSGMYISSGIVQNSALLERNQIRQSFNGSSYLDCEYIERSGTSFINGNGRNFTFTKVSELEGNGLGEYHLKVFEFYNKSENLEGPFITGDPLLGRLEREKVYEYNSVNNSFNLLQETSNSYETTYLSSPQSNISALFFFTRDMYYQNIVLRENSLNTSLIAWDFQEMIVGSIGGAGGNNPMPQGCDAYPAYQAYCIINGTNPNYFQYRLGGYGKRFSKLTQSINKQYYKNTELTISKTYSYEQAFNFQLSEIFQTTSEGDQISDVFSYPTSTNNPTLFDQNRLKELIKSQRYVNGQNRFEKEVIYSSYNSNQILPQRIVEKQDGGPPSDLLKIVSYDSQGNIREIVQRNGVPTVLIWGYGGSKIVLKVEGATYDQVLSGLGGTVNFADNNRNFTQAQIASLRNNLSSGMVSHYIFGSHHGLTRVTDQNGINVDFSYDSYGRLIQSTDDDGNILERFEYNLSTEN